MFLAENSDDLQKMEPTRCFFLGKLQLMEKILHQLIGSLPLYLEGFKDSWSWGISSLYERIEH